MIFEEYKKLAEMEDFYWWHIGRKFIIEQQLRKIKSPKKKILNIGCGTGGTVQMLSQFGEVFNVDTSDEAINFSKKKGIHNVIKIDGAILPFQDNTFDIVVGLDVIEHIKDESTAIEEWRRVLNPEGVLLITAPAYQWLWSEHDESLHHFRRYTLRDICTLTKDFSIIKKSYIVTFALPMIAGYRLMRKMFPGTGKTSYVVMPAPLNKIFILLLRTEALILNYFNFPCGTSVFIIAQKKK